MNNQSFNLPANQSSNIVSGVIAHLRKVRSRTRLVLWTQSILASIATVTLAIIAVVFVDYFLRLPSGVRIMTLGLLIYLIGWCWVRILRPALSVSISETDVALKIEHQDPSLRGLIASAADLDRQVNDQATDQITAALGAAALSSINARLCDRLQINRKSQAYPSILSFRNLLRSALLCGLIVVGVGAMSIRSPEMVSIGISRIFTPWSNTRWPMRHEIVDKTERAARPIDISVPIRAMIGSTTSQTSNAQASVSWRVLEMLDGKPGEPISDWTQTLLVAQHTFKDSQQLMYEQLIDVQSVTAKNTNDSFILEYTIESRDDHTILNRIVLVRPPELTKTTLHITVPEYAKPIANSNLIRSGTSTISQYDAAISPILAGSRVSITWHFSKPVQTLVDVIPDWAAAIARTNTILRFDQPSQDTMRLELIALRSIAIKPGVLDTVGIPVRKPMVLSLGVLADQNPNAIIASPVRDETVSTHAMVDLVTELSDDFGLRSGTLRATLAQSDADSTGSEHQRVNNGIVLVHADFEATVHEQLSYTFDLATLSPSPGDQVWITSSTSDLQSNEADNGLGTSQSPIRILRVVDDLELIDQIRNGLGPIHHAMRQLDEQQASLQEQLRIGTLQSSTDQRSLTNQLEANKRSIEQLSELLQRNMLDDAILESLLEDASMVLDEAATASELASKQLDRGKDDRASENQRLVRDRIGELLAMLDRGQDSWLALRSIQQLRDELKAIRDDTAKLTGQLAGQSLDELSDEQQSMLDRIVKRQAASADDARDALSTLDDHAEQLEEHDPTQAEALRKAARQGRSAQIEQRLKEASEQIASNQTSSATKSQTEVIEDLDEMLEELEHMIKNRDNALRRKLASIIESIESLIQSQETQINHINDAGADASMIVLVGNTLAVRDDALGAFPETRSIADLISQAAHAQTNAINALRQSPPAIDETDRHERSSLLNLNSALEEAERLDDQAADRQARQLRAELRDAYRKSLEIQTALRDETKIMVGQQLNRRQRADARALALAQSNLQSDLNELLEQTKELGDAPMFTLAHSQIDRSMSRITNGLADRLIDRRIINAHTSTIVILASLVDVLSDQSPQQEEDDFDDGSQGGSSGGSGASGDEPVIPPVAQLKLLRSMQQLAAIQTREYAENPNTINDADIESLADLQHQLFEHGLKLIEDMSKGNTPSPESQPTKPIELIEPKEGSSKP